LSRRYPESKFRSRHFNGSPSAALIALILPQIRVVCHRRESGQSCLRAAALNEPKDQFRHFPHRTSSCQPLPAVSLPALNLRRSPNGTVPHHSVHAGLEH
jgi:hypothetical protein